MVEISENNQNKAAHFFFWAAVIGTVLVAYGSLVPFSYRDYSFEESLRIFSNIPYLNLGAASRADWIANAIIYMPISFAWCGYVTISGRAKVFYIISVLFLILLAISIEYCQIFFAPRTVSQNDLLAEISGILIGFVAWQATKGFVSFHLEQFYRTQKISIQAILIVYGICFVLFSLFPYDFYISGEELINAFETKGIPLFSVDHWQRIDLRQIIVWGVEFCIIVPFGYLYMLYKAERLPPFITRIAISLSFFILLDFVQFFMVNGISFFVSPLMSCLGFLAGIESAKRWTLKDFLSYRDEIRTIIYISMLPFILVVLSVKGWHFLPITSFESIGEHLEKINYIPFFYHYYTTEVRALLSLMVQFLLVLPMGVLLALHDWNKGKDFPRVWWNLAVWGAPKFK